MIEIIPAIMPSDFDALVAHAGLVLERAPLVQIDIMDGKFVSGKTWPFNMIDEPNFQSICREEEGMPFWDSLDYELDLMVDNPLETMPQWLALGPKRIIVHVESLGNDPKTAFEELCEICGQQNVSLGVSFDDEYAVEKIEPFLPFVDFVQCMGIDEIGAQGQDFSPRVFEQLKFLSKKYPALPLSVDGAVSLDTAQDLSAAGATRLSIGSALFNGDFDTNMSAFESLLQ